MIILILVHSNRTPHIKRTGVLYLIEATYSKTLKMANKRNGKRILIRYYVVEI